MPSAWPTSGETTTRLGAFGLTLPSGYTAQNAIDEAVGIWHELVGFAPFLASTSATYVADPCESDIVHLRAPFGAITAVTVDGVARTIGTDVFLMPSSVVNEPYRYLQFTSTMIGDPGTISVTGQLGWLSIPTSVWNAVLDLACGLVQRKITPVSGEVSKVRQESVTIEYVTSASGSGTTLYDKTMMDATKLAARYRV